MDFIEIEMIRIEMQTGLRSHNKCRDQNLYCSKIKCLSYNDGFQSDHGQISEKSIVTKDYSKQIISGNTKQFQKIISILCQLGNSLHLNIVPPKMVKKKERLFFSPEREALNEELNLDDNNHSCRDMVSSTFIVIINIVIELSLFLMAFPIIEVDRFNAATLNDDYNQTSSTLIELTIEDINSRIIKLTGLISSVLANIDILNALKFSEFEVVSLVLKLIEIAYSENVNIFPLLLV